MGRKRGAIAGMVMDKWNQDQDDVILNCMLRARENNITNESAFLAAAEKITEEMGVERTHKAVGERYYYLRRQGKVSPLILPDKADDESDPMDLGAMFLKMKKVIRDRDEFRSKYEDALLWKTKFEEVNKKLAKYEKDSAALMEMMRKLS